VSKIEKLSEDGWELKDVDYVINALENLGENIERHSEEITRIGSAVEKAVESLTGGVGQALQKLVRKDNSEDTIKKISSIISLSLEVFEKKQSNLVGEITLSNAELQKLAKEIIVAMNKPREFKFEVSRNAMGLISEINAIEVKGQES